MPVGLKAFERTGKLGPWRGVKWSGWLGSQAVAQQRAHARQGRRSVTIRYQARPKHVETGVLGYHVVACIACESHGP